MFPAQALVDQTTLVESGNDSLLAAEIFIVVLASLADVENLNVRQSSGAVLVHKLMEKHRCQFSILFAKFLMSVEGLSDSGGRDDAVGNVLRGQFGEAGEELCGC